MGLERLIENPLNKIVDPPERVDQQYMDLAIYKLFFINVSNLIGTKAALAKNFHIQPSEIDKMPYWEYEFFMLSLNEQVKEENDKQKAEMDKYGIQDTMKSANPKNLQKNVGGMMPKMPNFGSMKAPSFKL